MRKPGYAAEHIDRVRVLRADATPAERELWVMLRGRKLGVKFRRQQPIGPFIADFYCAEAALVIELDGAGHAEQTEYDERRTRWLEAKGYRVLRFANADVLKHPAKIYDAVGAAVRALTLVAEGRPVPLPQGEREDG